MEQNLEMWWDSPQPPVMYDMYDLWEYQQQLHQTVIVPDLQWDAVNVVKCLHFCHV